MPRFTIAVRLNAVSIVNESNVKPVGWNTLVLNYVVQLSVFKDNSVPKDAIFESKAFNFLTKIFCIASTGAIFSFLRKVRRNSPTECR